MTPPPQDKQASALDALIADYMEAGGILMKMRLAEGLDIQLVKSEMLEFVVAARAERDGLVEALANMIEQVGYQDAYQDGAVIQAAEALLEKQKGRVG